MRDPARDADLIAEALQQIFVTSGFFGKKLERDGLAERKIICPINFPHAAFAKKCDDAVTAREQSPGKKSAFVQSKARRARRPRGC
jgi:hypothetical protein